MDYGWSLDFQERMREGKDAATRGLERRAYLGAAVTYKRPSPTRYLSVDEAARQLGVSTVQVRKLCRRGAIQGAKRGRGKGSGWLVPLHWNGSEYRVTVKAGRRGPLSKNYRLALSLADRCPF